MSKETKKSDTHEEMYFHFKDVGPRRGTLFARKEASGWFGVAAICHKDDVFNRRVGRLVARRRYFRIRDEAGFLMDVLCRFPEVKDGKRPSYEDAAAMFSNVVQGAINSGMVQS